MRGIAVINVDTAQITGGDVVIGDASGGNGVYVNGGTLVIHGTEATVTGGASENDHPLYSWSGILAHNNAEVTFSGGSDVTATSGPVHAYGQGVLVTAGSRVTVTDSELTAESDIAEEGYVNGGQTLVTNGTFTATSSTTADMSNTGVFAAVDSTVDVDTVTGYDAPATLIGNGGTPAQVFVLADTIADGLSLFTATPIAWEPTRADHTFTGWFTAASGGSAVLASTFNAELEAPLLIYAQWAADAVTPVDPADPELAATGVTDASGPAIAGALVLLGLLAIGCATVARRSVKGRQ